ncbi:MAG: hypothetical protein WC788_00575 [Candidatus Paceibacterota bacterium]
MNGLKFVFGILLCLTFVICAGTLLYKAEITFEQEIGGHMQRAADSNTIDLATKEMETVIENMRVNGYTHGYTTIISFLRTPDEDVGFWYENMNASLWELKKVPENASQLDKSNVLMKLRETLTNKGEQGSAVTVPPGISRFPNNFAWALAFWFTLALFIVGFVLIVKSIDE